ncbi:MAG TPA: DUF2505 family protein [Acidimicrobiales bacterium]|nr:DUF2505 family protein [Acidimicrobiales bacterium]
MHFEIEQRFRAPRDAVEAAYVDPALFSALAALPKIGRPELLDQARDGDRVRQRVRYQFTGEVSGAVRRVVDPARLSWVEETVFDAAAHRSDVRIVPDHYGGLLESRMTITYVPADEDGGTLRRAVGEVRVHMPIVGGKVERAIVSGMREHAQVEQGAVERWFDGRPSGPSPG